MAIVTDHFCIVCPPRTGSTWLRKVLNHAEVEWWQSGEEHGLPTCDTSKLVNACMIRNPVTWLRSYFAYRLENPLKLFPYLDALIEELVDDSERNRSTPQYMLEKFAEWYRAEGRPFISDLFKSLMPNGGRHVFFIRQEDIPRDAAKFFGRGSSYVGPFCECQRVYGRVTTAMIEQSPYNESDLVKYGQLRITPAVYESVYSVEREFMERHGYC